jgi:hypothetical protein
LAAQASASGGIACVTSLLSPVHRRPAAIPRLTGAWYSRACGGSLLPHPLRASDFDCEPAGGSLAEGIMPEREQFPDSFAPSTETGDFFASSTGDTMGGNISVGDEDSALAGIFGGLSGEKRRSCDGAVRFAARRSAWLVHQQHRNAGPVRAPGLTPRLHPAGHGRGQCPLRGRPHRSGQAVGTKRRLQEQATPLVRACGHGVCAGSRK